MMISSVFALPRSCICRAQVRHGLACTIYLSAIWIAILCSQAGEKTAAWKPRNPIVEVDFYNMGNGILFPMEVNGERKVFFLDTGCALSVLDHSLFNDNEAIGSEKKLGTKQGSKSTGKEGASDQGALKGTMMDSERLFTRRNDPPNIMLKDMKVLFGEFVLSDDLSVPVYSQGIGVKLGGIIGVDVLRNYCVHIDYDASKVILFHSVEDSNPPPGECQPLGFQGGLPTVTLQLGRRVFPAIVGTGCFDKMLVVTNREFRSLLKDNALDRQEVCKINRHFFNKGDGVFLVKEQMRWGENSYFPVQVSISKNACVVGAFILAQHKLTLDFKKNRCYVSRGENYRLPQHPDFDGILVDLTKPSDAPGYLVVDVQRDSLGDKSGLRTGDVLLKANGREIETFSWVEIAKLFGFSRKEELRLVVLRSGEEMQVTLPK